MKNLRSKHFTAILAFLLLGCQETSITVEEPGDPDMEQAWVLVNEFLSSSRNTSEDNDVTVLKLKQYEDLSYKTNTIQGSYNPLGEMTVTAETVPGGYVYWHAGGGVKELLGIEMDDDSQEALGESEPFEINEGRFWALMIPADFGQEDEEDDEFHLKYDIIYKTQDDEVVRLDPKIKIRQLNK